MTGGAQVPKRRGAVRSRPNPNQDLLGAVASVVEEVEIEDGDRYRISLEPNELEARAFKYLILRWGLQKKADALRRLIFQEVLREAGELPDDMLDNQLEAMQTALAATDRRVRELEHVLQPLLGKGELA